MLSADDQEASKNRTELLAASGRLSLPQGKVPVDEAVAILRPVSLAGNGSSIENVSQSNDWVKGRALAIRPGGLDGTAVLSFYESREQRPPFMPIGQVGWLFQATGSDGQGFYPAPNQRILSGDPVPKSEMSFMRAFKAVPFSGTQVLAVPRSHQFAVGEDVFCTDGPMINEIIPEFRRISAITKDSVFLNKRLDRVYAQGTLVGGPFPRDMRFQGTRFKGSWGPVLVQQSVDIQFLDCTFDPSQGWPSVIGSGHMAFANCLMPSGFQTSASHDIRFTGCSIKEVVAEQGSCDLRFNACRFGPGTVDSKVQCTDWMFKECVTHGGFFVYDRWIVEDHVAYGPVTIRGNNAVVRDLWSAQPVKVEARYQGSPPNAGRNIVLDRVVAPYIECGPGTSGTIRGRTCPVTGDTKEWLITPKG